MADGDPGAVHIQAELELAAEQEGAGGGHGGAGAEDDDGGGLERPALTFAAQPRPEASWKPCEGGSTGGSVTLEFKQGGGYTSYFAPRVQPGGAGGADGPDGDGADDLGEDDGLPS